MSEHEVKEIEWLTSLLAEAVKEYLDLWGHSPSHMSSLSLELHGANSVGFPCGDPFEDVCRNIILKARICRSSRFRLHIGIPRQQTIVLPWFEMNDCIKRYRLGHQ